MGTTAQKLQKVLDTKAAIKQAIVDKGVDVADTDTFASYPDKIAAIQSGGGDDVLTGLIDGSITDVTIPAGVTQIRTKAFSDLTSLMQVTIPDSVTSIGYESFRGCSKLAQVKIPDGVASIDKGAFQGCTNFQAIGGLPSGLKVCKAYLFMGCSNLVLTALPEGITDIEVSAFNTCRKVSLTSLPAGLKTIGDWCFAGSDVTISRLPASLTNVGSNVFYSIKTITELTFLGTPTTISNLAFNNVPNLITIRVPWAEGAVAGAPWAATNATIIYNYTEEGAAE